MLTEAQCCNKFNAFNAKCIVGNGEEKPSLDNQDSSKLNILVERRNGLFCLFSLANLPRGKKNMAAISTSTPQDSLVIYHWLKKENNYCDLRASCTLVHVCVTCFWHNNRNLSNGNGNN